MSQLASLLFNVFLLCQAVSATEPELPRAGKVDEWKTLEDKGFSKWQLSEFTYLGMAADGGSDGFELTTKKGEVLNLLAANTRYSTEEEVTKKFQVFYLIAGGRYYKVAEKSEQEKKLLEMLERQSKKMKKVGNQEYLVAEALISHLSNRKYFKLSESTIKKLQE